jgi:hypothetical protein
LLTGHQPIPTDEVPQTRLVLDPGDPFEVPQLRCFNAHHFQWFAFCSLQSRQEENRNQRRHTWIPLGADPKDHAKTAGKSDFSVKRFPYCSVVLRI